MPNVPPWIGANHARSGIPQHATAIPDVPATGLGSSWTQNVLSIDFLIMEDVALELLPETGDLRPILTGRTSR